MKQAALVNIKDIPAFANKTASKLKGGEIFALIGPLGSGKTTFVKAVGKELKIKQRITSPTYILLQAMPLRLKNKNETKATHIYLLTDLPKYFFRSR